MHLQNTAGAQVAGNVLQHVRNGGGRESYVHAVYAVLSTDLAVSGNTIADVSGDAIRTRASSTGRIWGNAVSGTPRIVSDWWCDAACAAEHGQSVEHPSSVVVE